ncbi:MAG: AIPR family protein [Gammaproteobacteria bacterium]|nr:AIPR family protein [Gammaproteobacteria bacterium]
MDLKEYAQDLLQDVHAESDADGEFLEDVFFQKACDQLTEAGELETADRVSYRSPTRGIRVDGYGGDPSDSSGTLSLIILDFHVSQTVGRVTGSEMDTLFRRLSNYLRYSLDEGWRDALEETNPAFGLADLIAQRWSDVAKVRLLLVSNRALSERVDGRPAGVLEGRQVTYSVWDIRRLHGFAIAGAGREDMEIDLVEHFGGPLPVLPAQHTAGQHESYLAVIPGEVLADIYDRWGARLLEQNVRVFLQARGKVNRGIRLTLENEPSMFFAYNNGITATAEAVDISNTGGQLLLRRLRNFQIVNGGQTTASVHVARLRDVDISHTFVQMKLSVVSADRATTLVPKISEYANSQNRVSAADFFANHPFHVRMEEFSRRIHAPSPDGSFRQSKWFYERARGQYADARARLTASERRKFDLENPRRQLFTKTDLAKFINVWEGRPHEVSLGAQKNFAAFARRVGQAWNRSPNDFNEAWYRQAVAKAIVFRAAERMVSAQPWYQGGYRANIVAYTIAKVAHDIGEQGGGVDFESIWRRQALGPRLAETIAHLGEHVHDVLVDPPTGIRNVTEWAKKEGCWDRVRMLDVALPPMLGDELISVEAQKDAARDARRDQRQLNGIEAQIAVVNAGSEFWGNALKWGRSRELLTATEYGVLEVAARMPQRTPTEKQSAKAVEVLGKLQSEGYQAALGEGN